jgi:hypothetical protein
MITSSKLPTIKVSDALRALGIGGAVRGYGANEAEIRVKGKVAVRVACDPREGTFEAVLLNEWDDASCTYGASTDVYNDCVTSESWSEVANWIKQHFAA